MLIREGISIVKENAMTCISSIAESASESFFLIVQELIPLFLIALNNLLLKNIINLEGKQLNV